MALQVLGVQSRRQLGEAGDVTKQHRPFEADHLRLDVVGLVDIAVVVLYDPW